MQCLFSRRTVGREALVELELSQHIAQYLYSSSAVFDEIDAGIYSDNLFTSSRHDSGPEMSIPVSLRDKYGIPSMYMV